VTLAAAPLLALALAAAPPLRLEGSAPAEVEVIAVDAWARGEALLLAEGLAPPAAPRPIRIGPGAVPAGAAAASRPGVVVLAPGLRPAGDGANAIRHELAHQLLFEACPAAASDRLFHEAFAIVASGELAAWAAADGPYLSLARALETLSRARTLDAPTARRALARLLADAPAPHGRLPAALGRRLSRCEPGAVWEPLRPEELADPATPAADALVVLSRHSGEALLAEGAATLPLPFGSTLKPFLLAGARAPFPVLTPDPAAAEWRCGDAAGPMDAPTALLRSCNGWFLAWGARAPEVAGFGAWGPVLLASGLSAPPADVVEAIGLRPALRIPALGLAGAYRLLAEARPDLVDVLSRNAREGTLARLPSSAALAGVAAKTGTVLDAAGNPRLGWIVAIDRDVVIVMARAGRTPRTFAPDLVSALARARTAASGVARVQVLGLLPPGEITGRCAGRGFVAGRAPRALEDVEAPLATLARDGALVCAGGPWLVRPGAGAPPRPYAGVFTLEPAPPLAASAGPTPTAREARARRGSDLILRTTRLLYAAGVVAAEDAAASGEARVALARIADANGAHPRHPGRPVCDTTHCQAFQGTPRPGREERTALAAPLRAGGWLPFARGGAEPWSEVRPLAEVRALLGPDARALVFAAGRVGFVTTAGDGVDRWEERRDLPCEALRGPLKLPACPERATLEGDRVRFDGRGAGHGEGLDLEWAKRSGLPADGILRRAYPALR
jgi:hypothetical protein